MKKGIKIITAFTICLLLITISAPLAFAGNGGGNGGGTGNGAGNGTGGNDDIALTLVSSSIKDGDNNVPLNPTIDLQFNKNVVNLAVKDNNSKCFHLVDNAGKSVTIKIIFPDDQLRSDYKEQIFITPDQNLAPNSKYTLYIDNTLQAKNTKSIDNAYMIAFTTGSAVTTDVNASLKDLADDVQIYTNTLPTAAGSYLKEGTTSSTGKSAISSINNNTLSLIIIGAVIAVILIFFVILLLVRKKSKSDPSNPS